jgi:ankyrin repeat protein
MAISRADIDTPDIFGDTPLLWAVTLEEDEFVQSRRDFKANVNLADIRGFTPLMMAAVRGLPSCVDLLVHAGANLHAVNPIGMTALSRARYSKSEESRKRLMYHEAKLEKKSDLFLQLAEE